MKKNTQASKSMNELEAKVCLELHRRAEKRGSTEGLTSCIPEIVWDNVPSDINQIVMLIVQDHTLLTDMPNVASLPLGTPFDLVRDNIIDRLERFLTDEIEWMETYDGWK